MRTSRLEAFSDGVLAIIITVMVLELREPAGSDLAALWHTTGIGMLSYLLSFVYVGIYWTNHHHVFQLTERVTGGILWANLALLFFLSLFPFTTQWMDASGYARAPVITYGVNLLVAAIAYYVLQSVIIRAEGEDSPLRTALGSDVKGKASPLGYIAGAVAAGFGGAGTGPARPGIWIAVACYVAVAALWVIPDRRIESRLTTAPAPSPAPASSPAPAPSPEHSDQALPDPSGSSHLIRHPHRTRPPPPHATARVTDPAPWPPTSAGLRPGGPRRQF